MRNHCRLPWYGIVMAALLTAAPAFPGHTADAPGRLDVSGAAVVVRSGERPPAEQMAATVLIEAVAKPTGLQWAEAATWPDSGPVTAITVAGAPPE